MHKSNYIIAIIVSVVISVLWQAFITLPACSVSPEDRDAIHTLASANKDVTTASKDLGASTKRLEGTAGDIQAKANDGKAKTPATAAPALNPIWDGIARDAVKIFDETRLLMAINGKLDGVVYQLTKAQGQVKEISDKLTDTQKELAAQKSKLNTQLTLLTIFGVVGIGISIAVGVLLKDGRIAAAGAAGCAVMAIAAILFSKLSGIAGVLAIGAGVIALLFILWILIETLVRMKKDKQSFWAALKTAIATNPLEDIQALNAST